MRVHYERMCCYFACWLSVSRSLPFNNSLTFICFSFERSDVVGLVTLIGIRKWREKSNMLCAPHIHIAWCGTSYSHTDSKKQILFKTIQSHRGIFLLHIFSFHRLFKVNLLSNASPCMSLLSFKNWQNEKRKKKTKYSTCFSLSFSLATSSYSFDSIFLVFRQTKNTQIDCVRMCAKKECSCRTCCG